MITVLFIIFTIILNVNSFVIPDTKMTLLCPLGVSVTFPDSSGVKYVAIQANVNEAVAFPTLGTFSNSSTTKDINGSWKLYLSDVILDVGDTLYFWLHIIYRQESIQSPMYSWIVEDDPCNEVTNEHKECELSVTRILNMKTPCKGELIFSEEFNDTSFDKWDHHVLAPDGEFQIFVNNRSNSFIKDGLLHIRTTLTSNWVGEQTLLHGAVDLNNEGCVSGSNESCYIQAVGGMIVSPTLSARLTTQHTFNFMYGRLEFRASTPLGLWLYPDIMLVPRFNSYGTGSFASGLLTPLRAIQSNKILAILGNGALKSNVFIGNLGSKEFHIYNLLWSPEKLEFSIDGNLVGTFNKGTNGIWRDANISPQIAELYKLYGTEMAPFDQMFYASISISVGGVTHNVANDLENFNKPWDSPSARLDFWESRAEWLPSWQFGGAELLVDYIKIYAI